MCEQACDFIEIIAVGGLCLMEAEDLLTKVLSIKALVLFYLIGDVLLNLADGILEGIAIHQCWSAEPATVGRGNLVYNHSINCAYDYMNGSHIDGFYHNGTSINSINCREMDDYTVDVYYKIPPGMMVVHSEYGLAVWLAGYVISVLVLVLLQLRLLPHNIRGATFWQSFK